MEQKQWSITQLYNEYFHEPASKLYQLHKELDKLVMKAYGFKTKDDILAKLLELNFEQNFLLVTAFKTFNLLCFFAPLREINPTD